MPDHSNTHSLDAKVCRHCGAAESKVQQRPCPFDKNGSYKEPTFASTASVTSGISDINGATPNLRYMGSHICNSCGCVSDKVDASGCCLEGCESPEGRKYAVAFNFNGDNRFIDFASKTAREHFTKTMLEKYGE